MEIKKPGYLNPIPKTHRPFHTVHIDHLGPFIRTKHGNTQILIIIDAFTKFILIHPVPNTKTQHVIDVLKDVFGAFNRIISDRGKAFTSHKFAKFCQTHVGDLVLLKVTSVPATGSSQKLLPKWRGPYRVSRLLGCDRYEVRDIPDMTRSQIPYVEVAGIDNIKPWIQF